MHTLLPLLLAAQATMQNAPVPAGYITPAEIAAVLENAIVKNTIDTPIKMIDVHGGLTTVAMLHRDKAETGSLIHERATETYYILHGSGSFTTGGAITEAKPTDLTRLGAGPSLTGARQGGTSRRVGPGDVIIVPAGTPHGFDQLDSPISYLVFRFDPGK